MPGDDNEIETGYVTTESTMASKAPVDAKSTEPTIDTERYGTGKPRRIVIRAQLTHEHGS